MAEVELLVARRRRGRRARARPRRRARDARPDDGDAHCAFWRETTKGGPSAPAIRSATARSCGYFLPPPLPLPLPRARRRCPARVAVLLRGLRSWQPPWLLWPSPWPSSRPLDVRVMARSRTSCVFSALCFGTQAFAFVFVLALCFDCVVADMTSVGRPGRRPVVPVVDAGAEVAGAFGVAVPMCAGSAFLLISIVTPGSSRTGPVTDDHLALPSASSGRRSGSTGRARRSTSSSSRAVRARRVGRRRPRCRGRRRADVVVPVVPVVVVPVVVVVVVPVVVVAVEVVGRPRRRGSVALGRCSRRGRHRRRARPARALPGSVSYPR